MISVVLVEIVERNRYKIEFGHNNEQCVTL